MAKMRHSISDTAEYGDYQTGKKIITEETRAAMRKALEEIQDGTFAKDWLLENRAAGRAHFLAQRRLHAETQLEEVGQKLRGMMSWLQAPKAKTDELKKVKTKKNKTPVEKAK